MFKRIDDSDNNIINNGEGTPKWQFLLGALIIVAVVGLAIFLNNTRSSPGTDSAVSQEKSTQIVKTTDADKKVAEKPEDIKLAKAKDMLKKSWWLVVLYYFVGYIFGLLMISLVMHWAVKKVLYTHGGFETTIKIVAICGLLGTFLECVHILLAIFSFNDTILAIIGWLRFVNIFFAIFLYFYLFKKWHKSTIFETMKVFGLMFLIMIIATIVIAVIIRVALLFFILFLGISGQTRLFW